MDQSNVSAHQALEYITKVQEAETQTRKELERWRRYKEEYSQLKTTLLQLPKETSHQVMVPIGKLAFMPGKLVHTNEILVLLGDNWFAERSASQAAAMVDRRQELVQENITLLEQQIESMKSRSGLAPDVLPLEERKLNEEGLPFVDIDEFEPEDIARERIVHHPAEVQTTSKPLTMSNNDQETKELFQLLDELELEEEEEAVDTDNDVEESNARDKVAERDGDESEEEKDGSEDETENFAHYDDDSDLGESILDYLHKIDELEEEEDNQFDEEPVKLLDDLPSSQVIEREPESIGMTFPQRPKVPIPIPTSPSSISTQAAMSDLAKAHTKPKPRVSRFKQAMLEQQQSSTPSNLSKTDQPTTSAEETPATRPKKKVSFNLDDNKHVEIPANDNPTPSIISPADIFSMFQPAVDEEDTWNSLHEPIYMSTKPHPTLTTPTALNSTPAVKPQPPVNPIAQTVVEKEVTQPLDEEAIEDQMLEREVIEEYHRKRQNLLATMPGMTFANRQKPMYEVHDEELPLSSQVEEPEEDVKPKKVSRFKAARLTEASR